MRDTLKIRKAMGQMLRRHRKRLGLSLRELAARANLGMHTIYDIEVGISDLTVPRVRSLSRVLGKEFVAETVTFVANGRK